MNWVLIIVLLLLAWEMIRGYSRGLLRTIYSLVAWILVLVFVMWATPYINTYITENTTLYEKIEAHCAEEVRRNAAEKREQIVEQDTKEKEIEELGIKLPEGVWDDVMEKTGDAADQFLENSGIYDSIAKGMAGFIVEGISFFIALITAGILVFTISQLLGIVSKIPIIEGINKTLGIVAGGMYGLIVVWVAFYLIALSSTSEFGTMLVSYIYESPFLKLLYENNLVITILMKYF